MAIDKRQVCKFYICKGSCEKGKKHIGYLGSCQKCNHYTPRSNKLPKTIKRYRKERDYTESFV